MNQNIPFEELSPGMQAAMLQATAICCKQRGSLITPIHLFIGMLMLPIQYNVQRQLKMAGIAKNIFNIPLVEENKDVRPYKNINDIPDNLDLSSQLKIIIDILKKKPQKERKRKATQEKAELISFKKFLWACSFHKNNPVSQLLTEHRLELVEMFS